MDVCPLAKPSKLLILDLVNQENGSEIAEEQLVFGEVESNEEGGNTALRLTAAPDAPWNSFVDTTFDRLDLGVLFNNERAEVSLPKGATAADLICHLNYTYDLKFDVAEFDVVPLEDGDLPELYKVTAKAGNMAYVGSVDVFADLDRMPLTARLTVTDLNGFKYPYRGPALDNVVYTPDTDFSMYGNFGYYSAPADPVLKSTYRRGVTSGSNGEVIGYMAMEVPTYDPSLPANQSGVGRFYGPRDAVDGTVVFPQVRASDQQPNAAPVLLVGIMDVDGTPLVTKDILERYDITLKTLSSNGNGVRAVCNYKAEDDLGRIDSFYFQPDAATAKTGAIGNQGTLTGSAGMVARISVGITNRALPGFTQWSQVIDGRNIQRVFGEGEAEVIFQRKEGVADPIVLRMKFASDPQLNQPGSLTTPSYVVSQPTPLPNGLGVVGTRGDTGGLVDYVDNGEVLLYSRSIQTRSVGGVTQDNPTRSPKTVMIGTTMEPWRLAFGLNYDIDELGDDRVMKEYDIQLICRSRTSSSASWTTETFDMLPWTDTNGKLQYGLKLQGGTYNYNAGRKKIDDKNYFTVNIRPNGIQSTAAAALADAPPFCKGLNVTQLSTARYAYVGQTELRWKLKRKDGTGKPIEMATMFTFTA